MARRKKTSFVAAQTGCRLFKLPAELRNRIYELVFSSTTHRIPRHENYFNLRQKNKHLAPGLLLTCKAIHAETMSMFYAHATFCVTKWWDMAPWLKKVGLAKQQHVNIVHYESWEHWYGSFQSQESLRDLGRQVASGRKQLLDDIHNSGTIIGDHKIYARMYLPGTKIYWTNEPKKVAQMFGEKLREVKKRPGKINSSAAWYKMIEAFSEDGV